MIMLEHALQLAIVIDCFQKFVYSSGSIRSYGPQRHDVVETQSFTFTFDSFSLSNLHASTRYSAISSLIWPWALVLKYGRMNDRMQACA